MHDLVLEARLLTQDASDNQILLLPNDPNIESWFARPKPLLSSPIVFVDQYFGRYVDEDFIRLQVNPPKLIIIGPNPFWINFFHMWKEPGAERLIDAVTGSLLPQKYVLVKELHMNLEMGPETFQIYSRK